MAEAAGAGQIMVHHEGQTVEHKEIGSTWTAPTEVVADRGDARIVSAGRGVRGAGREDRANSGPQLALRVGGRFVQHSVSTVLRFTLTAFYTKGFRIIRCKDPVAKLMGEVSLTERTECFIFVA